MRKVRTIVLFVSLAMFTLSCSEQVEPGEARVEFHLSDMPGEYQQVNVDVLGVEIRMNDTIIALESNPGVYNLLELVNGKDTLVADDRIPSGKISQIRLVLGENNSIMVDSVLQDLDTPSAQQSGLKLQVHEEILSGESYAYMIDFVVEKSIVHTGSDKYILKPVLRVFTEALSGALSGVVHPAASKTLVEAIMNGDTLRTVADTSSGKFMIRGMAEGSWKLDFQPGEAFSDTSLQDILLVPGQLTELDTLFLN